jgi:hypothetical protein
MWLAWVALTSYGRRESGFHKLNESYKAALSIISDVHEALTRRTGNTAVQCQTWAVLSWNSLLSFRCCEASQEAVVVVFQHRGAGHNLIAETRRGVQTRWTSATQGWALPSYEALCTWALYSRIISRVAYASNTVQCPGHTQATGMGYECSNAEFETGDYDTHGRDDGSSLN